jgi:hypothetical protein
MRPTVDLGNDSLFKLTIGTLWFCGVAYVLLTIVVLGAYALPFVVGPGQVGAAEAGIMAVVGGFATGMMAAIAAANFFAAWGLSRRKKWAWLLAVILGGLYAPSGCLPFGALILFTLLRSGVKESFEAEAAQAVEGPTRF